MLMVTHRGALQPQREGPSPTLGAEPGEFQALWVPEPPAAVILRKRTSSTTGVQRPTAQATVRNPLDFGRIAGDQTGLIGIDDLDWCYWQAEPVNR